jgi:serine/threonine-protein kinase
LVSSAASMKGTKVGSYIIEGKLGEGGMGVVYSAKHDRMNRKAVVKMLRKELADNPEMAKRFENEANAAASIGHPGIVQVFDIGQQADGSLYIVMELLRGESMQDRRNRQGHVRISQAISMIRQAAGALSAAHRAGIVHRDLKPDNMFIVPDPEVEGGERVKLLDFGIAKLSGDAVGAMQTKTGAMMGTPHYMSPEQCQGAANVDQQSDLYSLGCILFQLVTGRTPFVGTGVGDFIVAHMTQAPPLLRSMAPDAPQALEDVVTGLLAKDPAQRFGSADALANALGHIKLPDGPELGTQPIPATKIAAMSEIMPPGGISASGGSMQPPQPATTMGLSTGESVSAQHLPAAYGASLGPNSARDQRSSSKWIVMGVMGVMAIAAVSYAVVNRRDQQPPVAAASTVTDAGPSDDILAVRTTDAGVLAGAQTDAAPTNADVLAAQNAKDREALPKGAQTRAERRAAERKAAAAKDEAAKATAAKEKADKETAAKEKADRETAARETAAKEKADRETAAKEKADRETAAKEKARLAALQQTPVQAPQNPLPPDDPAADRRHIASRKAAVTKAILVCGKRVREKDVALHVTIGLDGRVKSSKLKPVGLGPVASCAQKAAQLYKFGPRRTPLSFEVAVRL